MPVLRLDTTDPFVNLALEEHLLDAVDEVGPTLLLWRNDPCVVIGRHQNPWVECNLRRMRADRLPLVRRISGGGAVYHDHGNANFSFIAPSSEYDQERHFRVVIAGLAALGIDAWKTDRNDLRVGERKISGNAFRHTQGHSLHHGTLLLDADLDLLTAYLAPSGALIQTKAITSVRSPVMNLCEARPGLTHASLRGALAASFVAEYGERFASGPSLDPRRLVDLPAVRERAGELRSWEWRYGRTPAFVRRAAIDGGISITVKRGVIVAVDGPVSAPVSGVSDTLVGMRYDREAILERSGEDEPAGDLLRRIAEAID